MSGTNWQLRGRCRCRTEGEPAAAFSPTQISRTNGLRQKWGGTAMGSAAGAAVRTLWSGLWCSGAPRKTAFGNTKTRQHSEKQPKEPPDHISTCLRKPEMGALLQVSSSSSFLCSLGPQNTCCCSEALSPGPESQEPPSAEGETAVKPALLSKDLSSYHALQTELKWSPKQPPSPEMACLFPSVEGFQATQEGRLAVKASSDAS